MYNVAKENLCQLLQAKATELAMMVEMMPDDAWDLVDDETKDKVMEVL